MLTVDEEYKKEFFDRVVGICDKSIHLESQFSILTRHWEQLSGRNTSKHTVW